MTILMGSGRGAMATGMVSGLQSLRPPKRSLDGDTAECLASLDYVDLVIARLINP